MPPTRVATIGREDRDVKRGEHVRDIGAEAEEAHGRLEPARANE
jgi:hypothetical protein